MPQIIKKIFSPTDLEITNIVETCTFSTSNFSLTIDGDIITTPRFSTKPSNTYRDKQYLYIDSAGQEWLKRDLVIKDCEVPTEKEKVLSAIARLESSCLPETAKDALEHYRAKLLKLENEYAAKDNI